MRYSALILLAIVPLALLPAGAQSPTGDFDLVLSGGRVMDPESGLDGVRNVGITAGRIAALSTEPLRGRQIIDVRGLVVAPGFIDLHAHGQELKSSQLQAQDGVTTALETELGTSGSRRAGTRRVKAKRPSTTASPWVTGRRGCARSVGSMCLIHCSARISPRWSSDPSGALNAATDRTDQRHAGRSRPRVWTKARWASARSSSTRLALDAKRYCRCSRLAARRSVPVFAHVRSMGSVEPNSGLEAVQEVVADAAATGASLHIMHIASSCLRQTPVCLEVIAGARRRGLDVTTEAYAYSAASTVITAATFDAGWQQRLGISYADFNGWRQESVSPRGRSRNTASRADS